MLPIKYAIANLEESAATYKALFKKIGPRRPATAARTVHRMLIEKALDDGCVVAESNFNMTKENRK